MIYNDGQFSSWCSERGSVSFHAAIRDENALNMMSLSLTLIDQLFVWEYIIKFASQHVAEKIMARQ